MAQLRDKDYEGFKKVCEKEGIKYETEAEYKEAADNLVNFFSLLIEMDQEQKGWERRLEKEPGGFVLPSEGRTCPLCKRCMYEDMWYDKWGMKCYNCQAALNKKIVPGYVFKDHKNLKHFTDSELSWKTKLHIQTIRKLVRQGKIKARVIPKGPMVFLKRENPDLGAVIETELLTRKTQAS